MIKATKTLEKVPTGIEGFDNITYGGLPKNRTTLLSGYAGCGKTVFSMFFILNGIVKSNEPGVFISLEEHEYELKKNFQTFGFDLDKLMDEGMLTIDSVRIDQIEMHSAGDFDLTALMVRIDEAIKRSNAKRLVIDTYELLFNEINNKYIYRKELLKLINWLKKKEVTAIFTAESKKGDISKFGMEEFVTDCVISLRNIKEDNIYTRRLQIVKYRGNYHGTNEYPFLIDTTGITLMPITNIKMPQHVSTETLSTGIPDLDQRLEKGGLYKGSSTMIFGVSGAGKTTLGISFCYEALKNNNRCLFFAFEESSAQLQRNMSSIGIDLKKYEDIDQLRIISDRPSVSGLEMHLVTIHKKVEEFSADIVVFDPVTTLVEAGTAIEVRNMLLRLMDFFKSKDITVMITSLINRMKISDQDLGISSLVDNIIELNDNKVNGYWEHGLYIKKVRGMSYDRRKYSIHFSSNGLKLKNVED